MRVGAALSLTAALILVGAFTLITHHQEKTNLSASPGQAQSVDDGFPLVDWAYWKSVNADVVGWVTIPGTHINTAIVQAPKDDPSYYLSHDIWGNWNLWGAIYLSAECLESGMESSNTVIYGHNMGRFDESQFSDLEHYSDFEFASHHKEVLIQTPEWKKCLQIDFIEVTDGREHVRQTTFADESEFASWYETRSSSALFALSQNIEAPKVNYSFVTCSYHHWDNERTIIYASLHSRTHQP